MEIKQVVESIILELMKTMQAEAVKPPPKVLYIFCDSTAHEAFMDHFIHLQKNGIQHDILFLDGETSAWLGKHKIEASAPGKIILADENAPVPLEVPMAYDGIVIPEIDLENAGRVSLGMKGTIKAEIIFAALVLNKFVLVGGDTPGLNRADRRTLRMLELPKSYLKLFEYYKKEMAMYGVEFAPMKQLAEVVIRKFESLHKEHEVPKTYFDRMAVSEDNVEVDEIPFEARVEFDGRFISAEWVKQQKNIDRVSQLMLSKGTILSPLAKDMLREKGIAVAYRNER
ncbi:hypothetical protein SAMN04487897_10492 [Paenibacillus sp. yr247]|uniref:hypothetical protein n=1 Tax=Paenibacillus sp. yr247 TaxID=1761880 RepID=UPI00088FF0EA|nr:hypothetical protein [Paenibacillus sp. yr247]SDN68969.1 hypothetical protein SAMN04487897_10492 [Paenibacillus sp. yr247]